MIDGTCVGRIGTVAQVAVANARAEAASARVAEVDPTWRPQRSLTDPNSIEGQIRRADGEAREAEAIGSFRSIKRLPDLGSGITRSRSDGTVVYTEVDSDAVFGVNSDAPG